MKAKGDDLLERAQLLRTSGESVTNLDGGADSERIAMVTPRSQSIGRAKETDPMEDAEHRACEGNGPYVRDDMSPEVGLRYTPVNTSQRRFDNDGYSLQPREGRTFVVVTCYNGHGEELRRCLTAFARNVFMLQQVFGEKFWEEMPISLIIDGRAMASQIIDNERDLSFLVDFCQNELGVFLSEVGPSLRRLWTLFLHL